MTRRAPDKHLPHDQIYGIPLEQNKKAGGRDAPQQLCPHCRGEALHWVSVVAAE